MHKGHKAKCALNSIDVFPNSAPLYFQHPMPIRVPLILVTILLCAGVPVQSEVRIAIVPGGDPKPNELLVLTEAKLFELQEIELLDRTDIDKVLAEQRLSGMFSADNAVALGQLLKTDLFVVLETTSVVIFDAHTGLRFVDETLPDNIERAILVAVDVVKTAVEKRTKLVEETLVTFGMVGTRNIDFSADRNGWCRAVAGMLERSLLKRGGAVLERSRLQLVSREQSLPGDATNRLFASMKLIDLEFTRGEVPQSFKVTAVIGNEKFSSEGSFDNPLEAVHKLAEQLLEGNVRDTNVTEAARKAEAARFVEESRYIERVSRRNVFDYDYVHDALEKIEIAVALDPDNLEYRRTLLGLLGYQIRGLVPRNAQISAETMRQVVQDVLRYEALVDSLPRPEAFRNYTGSLAGLPLAELARIANNAYPEYRDEIRRIQRRNFGNWMDGEYRTSLERILSQRTFETHLSRVTPSGWDTVLDTAELATPFAEIIANTLRLVNQYGLESKESAPVFNSRNIGTGALRRDEYYFNELLQEFSRFVWRFRSENLARSNPEAAATIGRTLVLMEQSPLMTAQIYAWLIRNRPVNVDVYAINDNGYYVVREDSRLAREYDRKVKAYLAGLPEGISFAEYFVLYHELTRTARLWTSDSFSPDANERNLTVFRSLAEILALANSRNEFAMDTLEYLISQVRSNRVVYSRVKEQIDPLVLRQIELGDRLQIGWISESSTLREGTWTWQRRAAGVGIGEMPVMAASQPEPPPMIARPWTSEINLFPKDCLAPQEESVTPYFFPSFTGPLIPIHRDYTPIIHDNVLYCTLRNQGNFYLGSVNLETLERQFMPLPIVNGQWFHFHHVDGDHLFFRGFIDRGERGLLILPCDGSESWTLSFKEFSDNAIQIIGTLDHKCYAVIGTEWVIQIDLKTRQWEQLSSSRAREGKTPFVDGRRIEGFQAFADPTREQILLMARGIIGGGVWTIQKDGTFAETNINNVPTNLFCFFDDYKKLLYSTVSNTSLYIYDYETDTISRWGDKPRSQMVECCVLNGYFWQPRSRIRIDDPTVVERLPIPEIIADRRPNWSPKYLAPTSDGKHLVVADDNEIVLLRFE